MSQGGVLSDKTSPNRDIEFIEGDFGGPVGPNPSYTIFLLTGPGLTSTGDPVNNVMNLTRDDNPLEGTGQTVDAVTADLISIPLGSTPTTYQIEVRVAGFESTTPAGCGYLLVCAFRTNGTNAFVVGTVDRTTNEDTALLAANATLVAVGNNAVVRVTGVLGFTINWRAQSVSTKVA